MLHELRLALRLLRRTPGFTAAAVLSLALGIGANTVIFSAVDAVLLRPLGYPQPSRLYSAHTNQSPLGVRELREAVGPALSAAGVFASWPTDLWREGGEAVREPAAVVSGGLLTALGVAPAQGRLIDDNDDKPSAAKVAVVTHRLFVERLGAAPDAVGRTLILGGATYQVVGVMPDGFRLPGSEAQLFVPFAAGYPEVMPARNARFSTAVVRLAPGVAPPQVQAALSTALQHQAALDPLDHELRFELQPLRERVAGNRRPALLLLFGAVALLLLVGCVNFANLLLARGVSRQRELAIRAALGASRGQIARQLFLEAMVLALAGGAAAAVLAAWALPALLALQPAGSLPATDVALDQRVLAFTLALSLFTGAAFGLVPALQGARADLHAILKSGSSLGARGGELLRRALVVGELSLCLVLLAGTGLLLRSFLKLQDAPLGFAVDDVVSLEVTLPGSRYGEAAKVRSFFAALERQARALPGVAHVGLLSELPLNGSNIGHDFNLEGAGQSLEASVRLASPGTFAALGIPLLRGRPFAEQDGPGAPPVVLVNDSFVRRYLGARDPLAARVKWLRGEPGAGPPPWMAVAGVVGDIRHRRAEQPEGPAIYYPVSQNQMAWRRWTHLVARPAAGVPGAPLLDELRGLLRQLDPQLAPGAAMPLREVVRESLAQRRFQLLLLGLFAAVALVLAAAGIYGVVSHSVGRRTRELGVRRALGAQRGQVLRMVLGQSLRLVAVALLIGTASAAGAVQLLSASLYGVGRGDPLTFAATALLLGAVTLLASWLPARRATRVQPVEALRED